MNFSIIILYITFLSSEITSSDISSVLIFFLVKPSLQPFTDVCSDVNISIPLHAYFVLKYAHKNYSYAKSSRSIFVILIIFLSCNSFLSICGSCVCWGSCVCCDLFLWICDSFLSICGSFLSIFDSCVCCDSCGSCVCCYSYLNVGSLFIMRFIFACFNIFFLVVHIAFHIL